MGLPLSGPAAEAALAFEDGKSSTFSKVPILIASPGGWLKDFELLAADDSPAGTFRSLGKLTTQNGSMIKSPYQEFAFRKTLAKYVKRKIQGNYRRLPRPSDPDPHSGKAGRLLRRNERRPASRLAGACRGHERSSQFQR